MHVTTNIFSFTVLCVFVSTTEMIDANVGKVVSSVGSYLRKHILMYFLLLHINIPAIIAAAGFFKGMITYKERVVDRLPLMTYGLKLSLEA